MEVTPFWESAVDNGIGLNKASLGTSSGSISKISVLGFIFVGYTKAWLWG